MSAAENLARWRSAHDDLTAARPYTEADYMLLTTRFIVHSIVCDRRHGKRESCNVGLLDAQRALLAFAEAVLAMHGRHDGYGPSYCATCQANREGGEWPCPTARLAETCLGGVS